MNILNQKFSDTSLLELIKNYGLDGKIIFGNKLEITKNYIILPSNYKSFTGKKAIGIIHLFLNIYEIDFSDLNNKNYDGLLDNENIQLKHLFKILMSFERSKNSFFKEVPVNIESVIDILSQNVIGKSSLWQFIKIKLSEKQNQSNFDDLISDYIFFKQNFIEEKYKNSEEGMEHGTEDFDEYSEHDGNVGENIEGEDNGVFGVIEPMINSKYFSEKVYESFNHRNGKFIISDNNKTKLNTQDESQTTNHYIYSGKVGRQLILPIDRHNLKISSWNSEQVEVLEDNYGNYIIKFLQTCETSIGLKIEKTDFTEQGEKTDDLIYTGDKIDFSMFDTPIDILLWIRQTKKYKNVSQVQFNTQNTNDDVEKLFESEEFDCLPANKLFSILCRSIGYPTRFITGISAYSKLNKIDGTSKTLLSNNKRHAWSEVYIDGIWKIFDATPYSDDDNDTHNEEGDLMDSIEQIMEAADDEEIWEGDKLEIKEVTDDTIIEIDEILGIQIDNPHFASAFEFVKDDALVIVDEINKVLKERKEEIKRKQLSVKKSRMRDGMKNGKLKITQKSIIKLAVGNPNIFEKKQKLSPTIKDDIDTRLKDIVLSIDISGSMGNLTGKWLEGHKADHAYLAAVLIYIISKELDVNFEKVVLFGDKAISYTPEDVFKYFSTGGGNSQNDKGIEKSLNVIKGSTKGLNVILSDGDGQTGQAFFNKISKDILFHNKSIFCLAYGLGSDAATELKNNIQNGKIPTVIEFRMQEAENVKQTQGYPLVNYQNLVPQLKKDLIKIMTMSNVKF